MQSRVQRIWKSYLCVAILYKDIVTNYLYTTSVNNGVINLSLNQFCEFYQLNETSLHQTKILLNHRLIFQNEIENRETTKNAYWADKHGCI